MAFNVIVSLQAFECRFIPLWHTHFHDSSNASQHSIKICLQNFYCENVEQKKHKKVKRTDMWSCYIYRPFTLFYKISSRDSITTNKSFRWLEINHIIKQMHLIAQCLLRGYRKLEQVNRMNKKGFFSNSCMTVTFTWDSILMPDRAFW